MCNCNQQRTSYTSNNSSAQTGTVQVKLIANNPLTINGDYTGRMYVFRNIDDVNWVDRRDLPSMENREDLLVLYA